MAQPWGQAGGTSALAYQLIGALLAVAAMAGAVWVLGGGKFGRAGTQAFIDKTSRYPRLNAWLNRHHGKFRAAAHYIEFGAVFLVLYALWDAASQMLPLVLGTPAAAPKPRAFMQWRPAPAAVLMAVAAACAWLDELHQLRSGGRQFRREDFLHSSCGICAASALLLYATIARGL